MFEYKFSEAVSGIRARNILVLKTRLMSNLYAENAFQFACHRSDKVEVVDDQVVFLYRQLSDITPQLKWVNLAQHFFIV